MARVIRGDDVGTMLVAWVCGAFLAALIVAALGGCATRSHVTTQEATRTTWTATEATTRQTSATSATVAASRTVRVRRQTERRPDGTVVTTDTTTTTDSGVTASRSSTATDASRSAAGGEAAADRRSDSSEESAPAGWPWWVYVIGWAVVGGLVGLGAWASRRWWLPVARRVLG